ncbi:MAG: DUF5696 domain-containing protein [Cellulosilyticaceae bacterium]
MKEIKSLFNKHKVTSTVLIIVLIFGIYKLPWAFSFMSIRARDIPEVSKTPLKSTVKEIPKNSGEVLVAESDTKQMYVDTESLNISVIDKSTKKEWNSIYTKGKLSDSEKSLLVMSFLGKDSKIYEWNSYKYSVETQNFIINQIEQGVQINFNMSEASSNRLEEYMPKKISIERYEELFLGKLDKLVSEERLEKKAADKYKSTLKIIYQKDTKNGYYFNKYVGNPPINAINQLIKLARTVEYTTEMLKADSEEYGIAIEIKPTPQFNIMIEACLEGDDFVVRIPTYEMVQGNDFYDVQSIQVLPNFGSVASSEVADGYILVPDGAGALFEINSYNGSYPDYTRSIYNNNYYKEMYEMSKYPENIMMPIYGMIYGKDENATHGFMSIIENGAELAAINVKVGTTTPDQGGSIYNKVYSSFDAMQYARLKIFGPYSDNETRYLVTTGPIDVDYTVRYKLFEKQVSYFDMAKAYQDYLIQKYNLTRTYDEEPKMFLDVIGAVTLEEKIAGIPYKSLVSLTDYKELTGILDELTGKNLVVNYSGVFGEGKNNQIMNGADIVGKNGNNKELNQIEDIIQSSQDELYLEANFMKVYEGGHGFYDKVHAMSGYDGKPVTIYDYNLATGRFRKSTNGYQLLHPKYLSSVVDTFIKKSKDYPNISIGDMGNVYYANYKPSEVVTSTQANLIVENNLTKLANEKTLILNNPDINKIIYGKYATNISRESSNYGTIYMSIPFRQLVMNGLVGYTTLDINMSIDSEEYYLLQALELGSYPKFTITSKGYDVLKNSAYTHYFATQYDNLKEQINDFYDVFEKEMRRIGSREIIDHKIVAENVFRTDYANGVAVITNYNKYEVVTPQGEIDALGYTIIGD